MLLLSEAEADVNLTPSLFYLYLVLVETNKIKKYEENKTTQLARYEYFMKKSLKIPRSRKSKNRRCNSQSKQGKRTNSDLQNNTQKTKDRATLTTKKKTGMNPGAQESVS